MRFEWDPRKAATNLAKHEVAFNDACSVFSDPCILSLPDVAHSNHEERWISLGATETGRLLVVVHTYRKQNGDEVVRLISARGATRRERMIYREKRR